MMPTAHQLEYLPIYNEYEMAKVYIIKSKCMKRKKTSLKLENLKTMVQFDRYFGWYELDRVDSMII